MAAGVIILAAGASTRLGEPKQLLIHQNQSLLQRAAHAATGSLCEEVVVVLGAKAESIVPELEGLPVHVVKNDAWQQGMGTSIRCGLQKLLEVQPSLDAALFILCDQPFVNAPLLNQLLQHHQQGKIVACAYGDTMGTPVLFDKVYFPELLNLTGQEGAKKLLYKYKAAVALVPFPLGAVDIDTAADYAALQKKEVR